MPTRAPCLLFPFSKEIQCVVTEGFIYSAEKQKIHRQQKHHAVDLKAPFGTPVRACATGIGISSYHLAYAKDEQGQYVLYKGKRVGFSLGLFITIYHPGLGLYSQYAHLSQVRNEIPYITPREFDCDGMLGWDPVMVYLPFIEISTLGRWVERGQMIGKVGQSGLSWGFQETPPLTKNVPQGPSWDQDTHLHMEVYGSRNARGEKVDRLDPFDVYKSGEFYKNHKRDANGLWLMNPDGTFQA